MERSNSPIIIRLKCNPLHQDVEGNYVEGKYKVNKPCFEVIIGIMAHLLDMTHNSQHREHSFHFPTLVPLASATAPDVGMIAFSAAKAQIAEYAHPISEALYNAIEATVRHIRRVVVLVHNESEMIQRKAELAAEYPSAVDYPLVVGFALSCLSIPRACLRA